MMSHPARSLGDRFCVSRNLRRDRGGGLVHLKPSGTTNSMAVSGLMIERSWLALGGLFLSLNFLV